LRPARAEFNRGARGDDSAARIAGENLLVAAARGNSQARRRKSIAAKKIAEVKCRALLRQIV
jgi:hypothetical protein